MTVITLDRNTGWKLAMKAQSRTYRWLARETHVSRDTVAAYAIGRRIPPEAWLAKTWQLLGYPELAA